ncbi:MAG: DUF1800 family protein [Chloroflexi bacterium]|nr:MAG: DUF1800 family protein [Chloroflexota bacterium]MBL1193629.1 DUF1800 family protein [Chloroflexota bacterium]NOH10921.1 DUF1800 domain-containing protein [Chloroflexota bacterium]
MNLSRREFLRLAGLVAAGASLQACAPLYAELAGGPGEISQWPTPDSSGLFRALSRITYGPRVAERRYAAQIGLGNWVEEQLAYEGIKDLGTMIRIRPYDSINLEADAAEAYEKQDVIEELRRATLTRQIYSNRQLYEVMVEFWTDHFNISVAKGDCWYLKVVDDREVIRAHALGNFRDLLWASAHSPAMMIYLDNQANLAEHPNENYARELMELHTLGVDAGYTQDDVMELARCLTGWTVKEHFWRGEFTFDDDVHDNGTKQVLGKVIEPNGISEAESVLEVLATHPATARFVSHKLVQRFITDDPEADAPELVERATEAFLASDGDIPSVLRVILLDGLVTQTPALPPKYKRPLHFITSALRMLNAETSIPKGVYEYLGFMGQPMFEWPTPDGPPERANAWTSNLMPRWKYALALSTNDLPGTEVKLNKLFDLAGASDPHSVIDQLSTLLIGVPFPQNERDQMLAAMEGRALDDIQQFASVLVAGLVAAPAFQWR